MDKSLVATGKPAESHLCVYVYHRKCSGLLTEGRMDVKLVWNHKTDPKKDIHACMCGRDGYVRRKRLGNNDSDSHI